MGVNLELRELMLKALGDHPIREFAMACGAGTNDISHLLNADKDEWPDMELLVRIVIAAQGRVKLPQIIEAARQWECPLEINVNPQKKDPSDKRVAGIREELEMWLNDPNVSGGWWESPEHLFSVLAALVCKEPVRNASVLGSKVSKRRYRDFLCKMEFTLESNGIPAAIATHLFALRMEKYSGTEFRLNMYSFRREEIEEMMSMLCILDEALSIDPSLPDSDRYMCAIRTLPQGSGFVQAVPDG